MADYNYINSHSVYPDHDQEFTASAGLSWQLNETSPYVEVIVGSGLRADATADDGSNIPNGASLPVYDNVNIGFEQTFKFADLDHFKARFDIINLFDQIWQLRDGSGIGVGAPQYGARRGFYGGLTWEF
ncbi:MAG: TonB-dependent receptor [Methylacidiphilales bacterium]|nr:TonB-dependent receptor [Candidatus Methylacidiphilales bacterium]